MAVAGIQEDGLSAGAREADLAGEEVPAVPVSEAPDLEVLLREVRILAVLAEDGAVRYSTEVFGDGAAREEEEVQDAFQS